MTNRKAESQIGEVRTVRPGRAVRFPLPQEGQVPCPVCHYPANRRTPLTDSPALYDHPDRLFPCRSDWVAATLQEMCDAIPPIRAW